MINILFNILLLLPNFQTPNINFGFLEHLERNYRWGKAQNILESAKAIGLTWSRQDIPWSYVQPNKDKFKWAKIDSVIKLTHESNFKILGVLGRPPKSNEEEIFTSWHSIRV